MTDQAQIDEHDAPEPVAPSELLGHPKGLFYLFFAEFWERFSFYGMRALLTLYMVQELFVAFEERDAISLGIYAAYGSLVYTTPVIGGMIADRLLGYRKAIMLGAVLMALGHFVLAIENEIFFYGALSLLIVGNGFFKPNISSFVGALYKQGDTRRDAGFTIFYMGINIGAWVAPLFCGWLGATYGWHYGFGVAGIGMLLGLVTFWNGIKSGVFTDKGLPPSKEKIEKPFFGFSMGTWVPILAFLIVPVIGFMMFYGEVTLPIIGSFTYEGQIVRYIFYILIVVILIVVIITMVQATKVERERLIVVVFLTIFMTLFWGFYELSGSTITLFAQRNVNLVLINASQTNAITAFYIVVFALPFSAMWIYLSKIKRNPRTPIKFPIGLALIGLGYYIFFLSRNFADESAQVPFVFLASGYLLFSLGELFMSPVGLSKVTELSPKRVVAFMMGIWFLSSAFAFQLVGFVSKKMAIGGAGGNINSLESLTVYTDGFEMIAYFSIGGAILAFLLSPILKRWMHGIH